MALLACFAAEETRMPQGMPCGPKHEAYEGLVRGSQWSATFSVLSAWPRATEVERSRGTPSYLPRLRGGGEKRAQRIKIFFVLLRISLVIFV